MVEATLKLICDVCGVSEIFKQGEFNYKTSVFSGSTPESVTTIRVDSRGEAQGYEQADLHLCKECLAKTVPLVKQFNGRGFVYYIRGEEPSERPDITSYYYMP